MSRRIAVFGLLAVLFVVESTEVATGSLRGVDLRVAAAFAAIWWEPFHPWLQALAVLGGLELTAVIAAALFFYLRHRGFHREAWALLALPIVLALEAGYKRLVLQPPPRAFGHADGPSLSGLVEPALRNSFPSGHMARTVLAYGLLAFVVHRLAPPGPLQRLAVPLAAVMIAVMALDRLYLDLHWESDVVGGLLLGGLGLAGSVLWIDRPRREGA